MPKNPTRNYAIEWVLRQAGLSVDKAAAVTAAISAAVEDDDQDATGDVFGDVAGSLLGPLQVAGILGSPIEAPAVDGGILRYDEDLDQWVMAELGELLPTQYVPASGSAATLDFAIYGSFDVTLTANCTITISGWPAELRLKVAPGVIRQDTVGGWTVTIVSDTGTVVWPDPATGLAGSAPTMPTDPLAQLPIDLASDDGGVTIAGTFPRIVASALNDLTDVTITAAASADKLRYDGSAWIDSNLHDEPMIASDGSVMTDGLLNPMMSEVPW